MTSTPDKTVALIDPLWVGHHPMYFTQFTTSFLRCGARVIGLCPNPEEARTNLRRACDGSSDPAFARFARLPTGRRSFFNGRFEGDPARTFDRWRKAAAALDEAEAACGWRADLVYFPYLDSYLRFLPLPWVPDVILNRPWSGLYLRNHHHAEKTSPTKFLRLLGKGDAILRSRQCLGIDVLDERFVPAIARLTGKPVTACPDVTQEDLPDRPYPLALEVKHQAAGRKIIGMIGLERRKGFLTLLRTAALARRTGVDAYFVAAGMFHAGEYTADEQEEILSTAAAITAGEIDNLHFDPKAGRIGDEADFNSLFAAFDIAWAAYEGFHGSSGTLSKAAVFGIPCLATAGECIGQRVERYRMGLTIPQPTPQHALAAIECLMRGTDTQGKPLRPLHAEYRDAHSRDRLDRLLADRLDRLPSAVTSPRTAR